MILFLVAFGGVLQVRTNANDDTYRNARQDDLVQILDGLNSESRRLQSEIANLQKTQQSLRSGADRQRVARSEARKRIGQLGILAGTERAEGPGVRITVTDPHAKLTPELMLEGVEELRDAGAEAMEINGRVRVVAQTWFEEAHGGIRVDGQVLRPPYTFDVIGDPGTLARALSFPGGFKDSVAYDGGRVAVTQARTVKVTVTRAPVRTTWANPAGGG